MLFILGSVLAGVLLYDHFVDKKSCECETAKKSCVCEKTKSNTSVVYRVKNGNGELSLPPCKLMGVELGPSTNTNKATLRIMVDKSVEKEYKPVTDIGKEKKYVKLTPTQYQTNIVLRTKEKSVVPITAYYST